MRKLLSFTILGLVLLLAAPGPASDFSNFFTPYGFRTPLLQQGQFALNFNPHYYRYEFQQDLTSSVFLGDWLHSESIQEQYSFSLNGIYALTDAVIFQTSLVLYPGQTRSTYRDVWKIPYGDDALTTEWEMSEHSNFTISPGVVLSFRPGANVQLHGDFHFSKEKWYWETEDEERFRNVKGEEIYVNLGGTILGRVSADKPTKLSDSQLFNFLRPYGFRAPVLSRGQYAVSLNSFYVRSESSWDQFSGSEWEKSIWRRYYFSLKGLYSLTERLLFQSSLDIYPAQTRQTNDGVGVGSAGDYIEMRSDFTVSPNLTLSLRPKTSTELYGTFRFTREDLHKTTKFGSQRDERDDTYYVDLGYTILAKRSPGTPARVAGLEFSDFFTPYGFRMPLLRQGQYALNVGSHYERTDSKEDYPSSTHESDVRSTDKTYYFSLNGVYAVTNKLILEGSLSLYPGQTRSTQHDPWFDPHSEVVGETETKRRSNFSLRPSLEISIRPERNMEFYGSFHFNKEKSHYEVSGERTGELKTEGFDFHLGFTILGGL